MQYYNGVVMQKPTVWDAIMAWRDDLLENEDFFLKKKAENLSNMTKLIETGIFDLEQPLSEFIKIGTENSLKTLGEILDWPPSTKRARRALLRSFHEFVKQKKIKKSGIKAPACLIGAQRNIISEILSSNEVKSKRLKKSEIMSLIRELCKRNARDSLICWMMWEFQCTIHQILSISISNIDFSSDTIKFKDGSFLGEMRADLKRCILAQKKGKSGEELLFTTETGKSIHPGQIVRNMKIASKRAKLPFIFSPKLLYADAKAYGRKEFLSLTDDERTRLCLKMATQLLSGKDEKDLAEQESIAL